MVKRAVFFGVTALVLVYGLLVLVNAIDVSRKPSDEEQIRAAIEEMRQASLESRDGGVIEYISDEFVMPPGIGAAPGPFNSGRDQVAKFIKNAKVDTLEMKTEGVEINGATALANVTTAGTLSYAPFFDGYEFGFPDMQIEFRRETRKRLLIVPDPTWAVIRVHGISAEGFNR